MAEPMTPTPSWNPLRCGGTALPPTVLMAAKLTAAGLVALGYAQQIRQPFMPLFGWPYDLPGEPTQRVLQGLMLAATACLMFNRVVRTSSAVIAGTIMLSMVFDRTAYTNAKVFAVVLLLFIALYDGRLTHTLLRWQMALMYFAAFLNKLLDADWRSGVYFDYLIGEVHQLGPYLRLADALPERALGMTMSWMTIAIELTLAIVFVVPRAPRVWLAGVALGVGFHGMSLVMTGTLFGIYIPAVLLAYLLIFPTPQPGSATLETPRTSWFARLVGCLDRDRLYSLVTQDQKQTILRVEGSALRGRSAKAVALIWLPGTWFALTIALIIVRQAKIWAVG